MVAAVGPASAEPIGIVAVGPDDPPVAASELARAVAAAARGAGAELVLAPIERARARLAQDAVPRARLDAFAAVRARVEAGWRAYTAVEIPAAMAELDAALRGAETTLDLPGGLAVYADVALRVGVLRLHAGDADAAADAFRLARALDPAREISLIEFSPDVVDAHRAAIAAQPPARPVRLAVTAEPSPRPDADGADGADGAGGASGAPIVVEIDGRALAAGSREVSLAAGTHVAVVRAPGYRAAIRVFAVSATGPTTPVTARLEAAPGVRALVSRDRRPLALGTSARGAADAIAAVTVYAELSDVVLVASAWRRGAPAVLGQRCRGGPRGCTRVVEVGYPRPEAAQAAVADLWLALATAERGAAPTLLSDSRLIRPEGRPAVGGERRERGCRACRSPWLWVAVGAAAVAATAVWLAVDGGDVDTTLTVDPCDFGRCEP